METSSEPLTDRRCEECDLYMRIVDRTPAGTITLYRCALGHQLFVGKQGQIMEGPKK